jgi:hypothetical protein
MSMVRTVYIKNKEYYVITTTLEAGAVSSLVQIHINVNGLSPEDKLTIQKHASLLLNRTLKITPRLKPQTKVEKPWYRFW